MLQMKEKEKQVIKDKFTVSLIVIYNTIQIVCLIKFKVIVASVSWNGYLRVFIYVLTY